MAIRKVVEYSLGWLLSSVKGHDDKLFFKIPAFADYPEPTITVESPSLGPSNSPMGIEYASASTGGQDKFPDLTWSPPAPIASEVKEYLVVAEDPDAPIPTPPLHGMYYAIPPGKTQIVSGDLDLDTTKTENGAKWVKGGFRAGANRRGNIYMGARPPCGHGPHRYFFQVVALKEKLDLTKLSNVATREEVVENVREKVLGWGVWIGVFENKWG